MEHIEPGSEGAKLGVRQDQKLDQKLDQAGSYYRLLDVDPNASRIEIREAYLRLKSTYGAGSAALYSLISEEEAGEQMAQVDEAFRILNDDIARRDYDVKIGLARATPPRQRTPHLGGFDVRGGDVAGLRAERLLYARGDAPPAPSEDPTIRTSRSTLSVIKLKANGAGTEAMQLQMQAMIDAGDPGDGDLFRRLREAAGVTEDEICERTKVSIASVQGIESNRFERLPQAVYVKGFLRSYFRYLAAPDAEKLVAAFSARLTDWQANRKA